MTNVLEWDWQDKHYSLDLTTVPSSHWKAVKEHTGLTAGQVLQGFTNAAEIDSDVAVALDYLGHRANGEHDARFNDDLPLFGFLAALGSSGDSASEDEAPKA